MEFYDKLGAKYDRMTNAKKRAERERPFFRKLVKKNNIRSAVDIGCGTGQHARVLAEMGIQVTGIDPSEEFLSIAKKNLREYDSQIILEKGDLLSVSKFVKGQVDAVFCIGNTLPHVLTEDDLISGMNSVREILAPEGMLILHVLNYSKILNRKRRIVNATKDGNDIFTRFYDFIDPLLRFNILVLHDEDDHLTPELLSTTLYPWKEEEILKMLHNAGLFIREVFGDYAFSPFSVEESDNLIIIAGREKS